MFGADLVPFDVEDVHADYTWPPADVCNCRHLEGFGRQLQLLDEVCARVADRMQLSLRALRMAGPVAP